MARNIFTRFRLRHAFTWVLLGLGLILALGACAPSRQASDLGQPPALFTPLQASCTIKISKEDALALTRQLCPATQSLPTWNALAPALRASLAFVQGKPQNQQALSFPGLTATWQELAQTLTLLLAHLTRLGVEPGLLAQRFRLVRIGPDFGCTGYYEPTIEAALAPEGKLTQALYRKPPDLGSMPYHTRQAIDRMGALAGRGLELAYVDAVDAFFLQVQGSGRLRFANGSCQHVLYAGKNNQPYVSLGRILKERGLLPEDGVNMPAIRNYLAEHPEQQADLLDTNPSYVFFRVASDGPYGSMGAVLTPYVSLAVDRNILPQGCVVLVQTCLPDAAGKPLQPFTALALPQDSGGAIKGHRLDLFCGTGARAAHLAGHLDTPGAVYVLLAN